MAVLGIETSKFSSMMVNNSTDFNESSPKSLTRLVEGEKTLRGDVHFRRNNLDHLALDNIGIILPESAVFAPSAEPFPYFHSVLKTVQTIPAVNFQHLNPHPFRAFMNFAF